MPLISVENFLKSVENLRLACGNAVECLGKSQAKNKNCKGHGAKGMGHGAWGIGHGALGMGHGALGMGHC
ncbi:hypothetical protein QUA56_31815 [Microcoleus sp. N3A4]|uniref:hypothetical protein n=1 Tax=Microcoleus sp. N3A4 TaxID=3055379 RepID=UPI002FD71260